MIAWEYGMFDLQHGLSNRFDFQRFWAILNYLQFIVVRMTRLILWCNAIV